MTPNQAQGGYMALMQAALNCHQFRDVGQPLHHFPIFVTRDATGVAKFPPYIIQRPANAPGVLQVSGVSTSPLVAIPSHLSVSSDTCSTHLM